MVLVFMFVGGLGDWIDLVDGIDGGGWCPGVEGGEATLDDGEGGSAGWVAGPFLGQGFAGRTDGGIPGEAGEIPALIYSGNGLGIEVGAELTECACCGGGRRGR